METKTTTKVNIAPSSSHGHFIEKAKQVINLDNVNETFHVKGESQLTTTNHTTLDIKEDCLITCQTVYDPFKGLFVKSKD
ncbi:MAG: hypothetical protein IPJ02_18025 [Chitinophagaceae bacterium]|nr:hypothetical protein [Chitinophagaceae bacterium]